MVHKAKRLLATLEPFPGWTASVGIPSSNAVGQSAAPVSFPACISQYWLCISMKPELCCSLQTAEYLAWLSGYGEISSFYRDGTENHHHNAVGAPAYLQESPCHLSRTKSKFPFESCGNFKQQFLSTGLKGTRIRCWNCSVDRHCLLVLDVTSSHFMCCASIFSTAIRNSKNVPVLLSWE